MSAVTASGPLLSGKELRAWASRSLACYAVAVNPNYELPPHVKAIIAQLELVDAGERPRLMISLPPRHGKSYLATVLFVGWYLGRHPDHRVIVACYGQELADDFGRQVRNLVGDPKHQAIFPSCRMSEDSTAANRFATTKGGTYVAVGAGGPITGRGADLFVIDDPIKGPEEASSTTSRRVLQDWFSQVARTRMQPGGKMVLIQNRWNEDDLVGWLLREHAQEGWRLLSFPAIAESDEEFRKEGEPLWPTRFPLEELENLRRQLGSAPFAALYQQRPVPSEGAIFKREWFQTYTVLPPLLRIVQSWDCAFKTGLENDYSACTTWGEGADGWYLLAAWRGKVEFPELKRRVSEFASVWKPKAILIEDTASGQPLIQELRRNSRLPIVAVKPKGDKIARANAVTPILEAGRVFLPANAEWREIFLDEVSTFPAAAHDDYTDCMTQALTYLQQGDRGGIQALLAAFSALDEVPRSKEDVCRQADMMELPRWARPFQSR